MLSFICFFIILKLNYNVHLCHLKIYVKITINQDVKCCNSFDYCYFLLVSALTNVNELNHMACVPNMLSGIWMYPSMYVWMHECGDTQLDHPPSVGMMHPTIRYRCLSIPVPQSEADVTAMEMVLLAHAWSKSLYLPHNKITLIIHNYYQKHASVSIKIIQK